MFPTKRILADFIGNCEEVLRTHIPLMLNESEDIKIGGGMGYLQSTYLFFATAPYIFVALENLENGTTNFKIEKLTTFDIPAIHRLVGELVYDTFEKLDLEEQIWMAENICKSLNDNLEEIEGIVDYPELTDWHIIESRMKLLKLNW